MILVAFNLNFDILSMHAVHYYRTDNSVSKARSFKENDIVYLQQLQVFQKRVKLYSWKLLRVNHVKMTCNTNLHIFLVCLCRPLRTAVNTGVQAKIPVPEYLHETPFYSWLWLFQLSNFNLIINFITLFIYLFIHIRYKIP